MNIKSVLFDLDGTLSDSAPGILRGVRIALESIGIKENDILQLRRFIGPPLYTAFQEFYGCDPDTAAKAVTSYRSFYLDDGIYDTALYDGVIPMLERLYGMGIAMYICTSKPQAMAEIVADHLGIRHFFQGIVGASLDSSRAEKTQVLAYLLDSIQPSAPVMVGDRHHDMHAAKEMHIPGIGVLWGYGDRDELLSSGACDLAADPASLVELIQKGEFQ